MKRLTFLQIAFPRRGKNGARAFNRS